MLKYNFDLSAKYHPRSRVNVPGHVLVFEMLQVNDCQASERQEREELTAWQLHCKHIASFFSSSPRLWPTASQPLAVVTQASQASANSILCGGISGSYQDNILVLGEVKLVTTSSKFLLRLAHFCYFLLPSSSQKSEINVIWFKDGAVQVSLSGLVALTLLCSPLAELCCAAAAVATKVNRGER